MESLRITRITRITFAIGVMVHGARAQDPQVPGLELVRDGEAEDARVRLGLDSLAELPVYEIDQAVDDVTRSFSARLSLSYTNLTRRALETLPLVLHPNEAAELGAGPGETGSVSITEVSSVEGPPVTFEAARPSLVLVRFERPIAPGERVGLAIRYQGRLRALDARANDVFGQAMAGLSSLAGAGPADYGLLAEGDGILTMASAYPMVAPFREDEFDTSRPPAVGDVAYNSVACFKVRTIVPEGFEVVTNLADTVPGPGPGGTRVVESRGALVRDFVLVGGRDFARETVDAGGVRVTSVFRKKDSRAGQVALETARRALESFERRFGAYPYRELDVVEASLVGGAGGVEFGSLVLVAGMLYRDPSESTSPMATLLELWGRLGAGLGELDPGKKSAPPTEPPSATDTAGLLDETLVFTVAHEVAHQWFAGVVGNDSRRFPSVDEPLAQYAAGLAVGDAASPGQARRAMDANVKMNYALYRLLGGRDRPVLRDTASFRSGIEYAGLVYGKAPYLYVELEHALGPTRLADAIASAVDRHRFKVATTHEWVDAIEAAAGGPESPVREVFRRYLEEARGDHDLGVDDSGDFVLDTMFDPEVASSIRQAAPMLGMEPKDLLRMVFGGGLADDAPVGPGLDPAEMLRKLLEGGGK